jgi:hypothetical protein
MTNGLAALATGAVLALGGCGLPAAPSEEASPAVSTDANAADIATATPSATATATASTTPSAAPVIQKRKVTVTRVIPYATRTVRDATLAKGTTRVRTRGRTGLKTLTYEVTLTDGRQTGRRLVSQEATRPPTTKVVAVGTKVARQCDENYSGACVPIASDVDCAGGSGNGPAYVQGPVRVVGSDIYGLDSDGDGTGCDT